MEWWCRIDEESLGSVQKGLNSLIILGAWTLWKHRNRCVFDGILPSLAATISQAEEGKRTWELAGAKGISFLVAQLHVNQKILLVKHHLPLRRTQTHNSQQLKVL
jgi:hypothetical protein